MAEVFEKAWGNYVAMLEFLTNPDGEDGGFNDQKGLIQLFNFATLLPYSSKAPKFNEFLLSNAINYAAPGGAYEGPEDIEEGSVRLEHISQLVPNYSRFLDQMDDLIRDAVNPTDLPEYKDFQDRVSKAQSELEDYQRYVDGKWSDWVQNNPGFPQDQLEGQRIIWERQNGHSSRIQTAQQGVSFANARRNAWLRSKISGELHALLDARTYFDDPGYHRKLPVAANHEDQRELWESFHIQVPLVDIDDFLQNDDSITFDFSTEEEHYSRVETKWKGKAKAKWGRFGGGGSVNRRKLEELSTKSKFACKISFTKFQEVEVHRAKWFQPILFDTIGVRFKEFWGPRGLLATYPVTLLMCRGMKVSVTISDEYKKTLEEFISGGGRVSFGPFFSGGASGSRDARYMDFRKTTEGFELIDNSKTIRLLGCRVRRPNWSIASSIVDDGLTMEQVDRAMKTLDKARKR